VHKYYCAENLISGKTLATNSSLHIPFWNVTTGTSFKKAWLAFTAATTSWVLTVRRARSGRKLRVSAASTGAIKFPVSPSTRRPT